MKVPMDREPIVPESMREVVRAKGYLPALRVGEFVFVAGQVGRDASFKLIDDVREQFSACFENLRMVLAEAGCTLDDLVDVTTYHVDMPVHWDTFREVKREWFPVGNVPWTCVGVTALAQSGLLLEVKGMACRRA